MIQAYKSPIECHLRTPLKTPQNPHTHYTHFVVSYPKGISVPYGVVGVGQCAVLIGQSLRWGAVDLRPGFRSTPRVPELDDEDNGAVKKRYLNTADS